MPTRGADSGTRPRRAPRASRRKRRSPRRRCGRRPAATASSRASSRRSTPTTRCAPGGTWPRSTPNGSACPTTPGSTCRSSSTSPCGCCACWSRPGSSRRWSPTTGCATATPKWWSPAAPCCTTSACRSTAPTTRPTRCSSPAAPSTGCSPAAYREPERTIVAAEILHAIIGHRRRGEPYTLEAGVVRVADALDMAQGRTRIPIEAGHEGIHSISAAAIDEVRIEAGEERPVRIEIQLNNSAGHLPGRRPAGDEDPRHPARGQGRSRRRGRGRDRETPAERVPALLARRDVRGRTRRRSLRFSSLPWISDMTTTRTTKKPITPKQKKVTVLSVVGPARPTPLSASAVGAATSIRARNEISAARVRFTAGNLAHPQAPGLASQRGRRLRSRCRPEPAAISAVFPQIRAVSPVKIL